MAGLRWAMLRTVLRRPALLPALLGLAWACRPRRWYLRPPFLPVPPRDYLAWRVETAYGSEDQVPPPEETARYLRWASRMRGGR
jgi:hypothetical protein